MPSPRAATSFIFAVQLLQIPQSIRSLSTMSHSAWKLHFDNRILRQLPVDPIRENYCRTVPNAIYSLVDPTPLHGPKVVAWSPPALALLGLPEDVAESDMAEYLSGNKLMEGSEPAAHCYCGHQFGSFAGQLGDGAAILLGEVINPHSGERWELQLKGAGKTPYSRSADGRKVLRSSIREFLCSEAMHFLGIPTTRAVSCVTSLSTVERDPFYSGESIQENCTVVARIAPTFLRFGSFEIFKPKDSSEHSRAGPSAGNDSLKEQLLQFVLSHYYPELQGDRLAFLKEVARRTAVLCAKWQAMGFVHGVLNTDNMSILGLTIDYGPFAFMEQFDPDFVPNGSDGSGRYSYANQPRICAWNLQKLAEALVPLVDLTEAMQAVQEFDSVYPQEYLRLLRAKLGLSAEAGGEEGDDEALVHSLFETMLATRADFTDTFVALTEYREEVAAESADVQAAQQTLLEKLVGRSARPQTVAAHFKKKLNIHRLGMPPGQIELLEQALAGDGQLARRLFGPHVPLDLLREEVAAERRKLDLLTAASHAVKQYTALAPEDKAAKDRERWTTWLNAYWARTAPRGAASPSTNHLVHEMRRHNPTVVLRGWMAQACIERAEKGDVEDTRALLQLLLRPFEPSYSSFLHNALPGGATCTARSHADAAPELSERQAAFLQLPPAWADSLYCTCSS